MVAKHHEVSWLRPFLKPGFFSTLPLASPRIEMAETLPKAGADPNIRNKAGLNFFESVDYGYKDSVRPLLQ